jgi:hypothetical protein
VDEAETALRENLSVGFLLLNGTDYVIFGVGWNLTDAALDGLQQLYARRGMAEEERRLARRLVDPSEVADLAPPLDSGGAPRLLFGPTGDPRNQLAFRAADTTLARSLRWVYLYNLVPAVVCTNPVNLLQGRSESLETFLAEIRPSLVRFPSEEPAFETFTEHLVRMQARVRENRAAPELTRWMAVPSVLFRSPTIQACMAVAWPF